MNEAAIFTVLRSFLLGILPSGVEVIKGQGNRVAEPQATDYVIMTPLLYTRLSTNYATFNATFSSTESGGALDSTLTIQQSMQLTVQLDVHGPAGANHAQLIALLFCDDYAFVQIMALGVEQAQAQAQTIEIAPLYCSDPKQLPFLNAEQQYEDRYVMELMLQINPVVQMAAGFADVLGPVGVIDVEAVFPA